MECMMWHVANAGVILSTDEHTQIGIDCFCKDNKGVYEDTPSDIRKELLEQIEQGNIKHLIFTHEHEDHFCPEDVKEAWLRNTALKIYGGNKVVEMLEAQGVPGTNLVTVTNGGQVQVETFQLDFLETIHEGTRFADIANFTLLVTVGEQKIVIIGDAMPQESLFEQIAEWGQKIDGMLLPFPYVGLKSTRKLIEKYLNIDKIFVLHQPRKEADEQNWIGQAKKMCENASDALPFAFFPERLGKWYFI